jgi:hypothetical protein
MENASIRKRKTTAKKSKTEVIHYIQSLAVRKKESNSLFHRENRKSITDVVERSAA